MLTLVSLKGAFLPQAHESCEGATCHAWHDCVSCIEVQLPALFTWTSTLSTFLLLYCCTPLSRRLRLSLSLITAASSLRSSQFFVLKLATASDAPASREHLRMLALFPCPAINLLLQ